MIPPFRRMMVILLTVLALLPSSGRVVSPSPSAFSRWIVELESPPLALAPHEVVGRAPLAMPTPNARLNADSPASVAYLARLSAEQDRFAARLERELPGAAIERRYGVVLNAVAVQASPEQATRLRSLPGVKSVTPDEPVVLNEYATLEQMNVESVWRDLGGQNDAGRGMKIAVIDGGILLAHPSFSADGFQYPPGFPRGEVAHTNAKVIAARAYFRAAHPPTAGNDTPEPGPASVTHGMHVASIAAGNPVVATIEGLDVPISGVAPGAYLMNYRVFYPSTSPIENFANPGGAFTAELLAAMDDAVKDGADVINRSLGAGQASSYAWTSLEVQAINAATAAGVVVVNSAGNSGPIANTIGSSAGATDAISVGAVTPSKQLVHDFIQVVGPGTAPENLQRLPFSRATFGAPIGSVPDPITGTFFPATPDGAACEPLEEGSLAGQAALITRGICPFALKALHAQDAGAVAVIFINTGDDIITPSADETGNNVNIPAVIVTKTDGALLVDWLRQHGAAAKFRLRLRDYLDTPPDVLADFSSRGPTNDELIKPDVVAPGVNIIGAGEGPGPDQAIGYGAVSGTSQAAPQVSGAAALLRQVHPEWSPAQVKAALMATADTAVTTSIGLPASPIDRGAGRIDVGRAANPPFFANPPAVSFGVASPGSSVRRVVRLAGVSKNEFYTSHVRLAALGVPPAGVQVTVTPERFALGPGQYIDLTVEMAADPTAPAADIGGDIIFTAPGATATMPFGVRIVPTRDRPLLVLDNDGSADLGLPDYASVYTETLNALGMKYDVFDADAAARRADTGGVLPPLWVLQQYQSIIWFTGDRTNPASGPGARPRINGEDQQILGDYLNGGGRMLGMGKHLGEAVTISGRDDPVYGRPPIYSSYFGAQSRRSVPAPEWVTGTVDSPLAGLTIHLSISGDLPVIQIPTTLPDWNPPELPQINQEDTVFLLVLHGEDSFGTYRASEPTEAQPRRAFAFRTALLGFGLEDVIATDRAMVLKPILVWFGH